MFLTRIFRISAWKVTISNGEEETIIIDGIEISKGLQ